MDLTLREIFQVVTGNMQLPIVPCVILGMAFFFELISILAFVEMGVENPISFSSRLKAFFWHAVPACTVFVIMAVLDLRYDRFHVMTWIVLAILPYAYCILRQAYTYCIDLPLYRLHLWRMKRWRENWKKVREEMESMDGDVASMPIGRLDKNWDDMYSISSTDSWMVRKCKEKWIEDHTNGDPPQKTHDTFEERKG